MDEPQRLQVTAAETGQVFGVPSPRTANVHRDFFLSATAAYGLHRLDLGNGKTDWMPGMFGPDAGPGTVWRLSATNGYRPEKFVDVELDGRANTGASLGNIAFDPGRGILFVSDLETGMIHAYDGESAEALGTWDHGVDGRSAFFDAASNADMALDPVSFDPQTAADTEACAGPFDRTPACWNIADFRRRVWGLDVRTDADGVTRLYYSVWAARLWQSGLGQCRRRPAEHGLVGRP